MDVDRLKEIPVEKEVERQSNKIKNNFFRVNFFCVLSILTPFSSIFAENYELFFARSGSLIVVFLFFQRLNVTKMMT
jgi:hypothetical protein